MSIEKISNITVENFTIASNYLKRDVRVDAYLPHLMTEEISLLLINDGQDLVTMKFDEILDKLSDSISPLLCVGIHCSADRKNEYGTANVLDYKGRGAKAALYDQFIFEELLPFIRSTFSV